MLTARKEILGRVLDLIQLSRPLIDDETFAAIDGFAYRGEPEMAFEGMILGLMTSKAYLETVSFSELQFIAKLYNLDKDPVLDGNFWQKFILWQNRCK